jgi:cell wall-associated NlpC family hydrolase
MSLITAPANILGVAVPHPGLGPTSFSSMFINGAAGWKEDVMSAMTGIDIDFNIDGTPNVIITIEDPQRSLLRSQMALQRSSVTIDGITFIMAEINKSGPQLELTFEHSVCSKLKDHVETISARANSITRTGFCQKLVAYEGWIKFMLPGGPSIGDSTVMLSTGNVDSTTGGALPLEYATTYQELESFWDSTGTILSTIGWRRFPRGSNQLIVASDQWLYNQSPIATIDEDTTGVLSIDFDYDIRKPLGSITITVEAATWAFPVGSVVAFTSKMGIIGVQDYGSGSVKGVEEEDYGGQLPPVAGHWLVTDITRSLLSAEATITLDVPNIQLTEPQTQPPSSATNEVASYLGTYTPDLSLPAGVSAATGKNASSQVATFVKFALSKEPGPYLWGGTGPVAYDCSGLVQAAAATVGVSLPHNAYDIYEDCVANKTTCSVQTAIATYGALLFIAPGTNGEPSLADGGGHVAISLGNGQTIEATGVAEGICINVANTSRFNLAGLLPGVTY